MFRKQVFLIGLVMLVAGLGAVLITSRGSQEWEGNAQEGNAVDSLVVGEVSGYTVPTPLEAQVRKADSIALATVESVGPPQWDTPGIESVESIQETIRRGRTPCIIRPVTLRVEEYLKAPQEESVLTIHQIGGELDGIMIQGPQELEFQEGMKVVIFLERQHPPSPIDWGFSWAYVINGDTAYDVWGEENLPVNNLLASAVGD